MSTGPSYRILGLKPGASLEEIKHAYHGLVKQWHPDLFPGDPREQQLAEEKMREINEAYENLLICLGHRDAGLVKPKGFRPHISIVKGPRRRRRSIGFTYQPLALALIALLAATLMGGLVLWWTTLEDRPPAGAPAPGPASPAARTQDPGPKTRLPGLAPPQNFTLGSTKAEVLKVQGPPTSKYGNTWMYGAASVFFSRGRVIGYENQSGELHLLMLPQPSAAGKTPANYFTLGSTRDEVLAVQGTPTAVRGSSWMYGLSAVEFDGPKVVGYSNLNHNLRVRLQPQSQPSPDAAGSFDVGSTPEDVLAVQGTPTSILGNTWMYGFSTVRFHDGKVSAYNNIGENLRVPRPAPNPESRNPNPETRIKKGVSAEAGKCHNREKLFASPVPQSRPGEDLSASLQGV